MMIINVLRLAHRKKRDARITTHVCLTARAFGANGIILSGEHDKKIMENVESVVERWGGDFKISYNKNYMNVIEEWQRKGGEVIHLTMYGVQANTKIAEIKESKKDKLIVVGGSRVPTKVYKKADWNISITNQPHSEVSSLAIFQHLLMEGKEFDLEFTDGKMEIVPEEHGKTVIIHEDEDLY